MANSIKFPTMLTNVLDSRHERCAQMVSDVCNLVTNYSGLPANEKFVYNYRGRARRKVIKNISTSQFMIGKTPVVELNSSLKFEIMAKQLYVASQRVL